MFYFSPLNYIDQRLADLTENFTLDDWRAIQTDEYWAKRDKLPRNEINSFLLEKVEEYLKINDDDPFTFLNF